MRGPFVVALLAAASHPALASAPGATGNPAAAAPAWSLHWAQRSDAAEAALGQPVRPRRQTTTVARRFEDGTAARLGHEFRDLDLPSVDGVAADTNGFVHRLTLQWERSAPTHRLRLGGTLAVSSNALKHPGELGLADLRPWLSIAGPLARSGPPLWLGLHADDRLGRTRVYPGVALELQPAAGHAVRLGFPESAWSWAIAPTWTSAAAVEPDGACWRVRDRELARRTEVCSRAWSARWTVQYVVGRAFVAEASAGYRFGSTLQYTLRDGRDIQVDVPSGAFFGLGIGARF